MRLPFTFTRPGSGWVMDRSGIYVERGVDEPRFQWTPDGKSEGLLVERVGTNVIANSRNLDNTGYWTHRTGDRIVTRIDDRIFEDAFELRPVSGVSTEFLFARNTGFTTSERIVSIFAKAGTWRYIRLGNRSFIGRTQATFDLQTGAAIGSSDVIDAVSTALLDGWFDLSFKTTATGGTAGFYISLVDAERGPIPAATGDETVYLAYPGIVEGTARSSPIPTSGTAVTRPADTLYADMSLVPGFDPTRGTIVVDVYLLPGASHATSLGYFSLSNSLSNPYFYVYNNNVFRAAGFSGPNFTTSTGMPEFGSGRLRVAVTFSEDRIAWSGNGLSPDERLGDYRPTGANKLSLGGPLGPGVVAHNQLIRLTRYIPHAVSDAQLQQLSSLP